MASRCILVLQALMGILLACSMTANADQVHKQHNLRRRAAQQVASNATRNLNDTVHQIGVKAASEPATREEAENQVLQMSYADLNKQATSAILSGLRSVIDGNTGQQTLVAVSGTVVTGALAMIPTVGPLLSGLVGLFLPSGSTQSVWDQIKDLVDVKVGEAMRQVQVDWVSKQLNGISKTLAEYVEIQDCSLRKGYEATGVKQAYEIVQEHVKQNADGTDPDSVEGGTDDMAALQRALLGFAPQVSLGDLTMRAEILELTWLGFGGCDEECHRIDCESQLTFMRQTAEDYVTYLEPALASYMDWFEDQRLKEIKEEKDQVYSDCLHDEDSPYYAGCLKPCGSPGAGCPPCFAYYNSCITACFKTCDNKREAYEADEKDKLPAELESTRENMKDQYITPLEDDWLAIIGTLEQHGFCTLLSARGTIRRRERMGMNSFVRLITEPAETSDLWASEAEKEAFDQEVASFTPGHTPSGPIARFIAAWQNRDFDGNFSVQCELNKFV